MDVTIPDEIDRNSGLARAVREATELLDEEIGRTSIAARAAWSLDKDENGRDLLYLRVSDWTGSVGYRFVPEELSNANHMKARFSRLWGDFLQVRSHVQMDESWWSLEQLSGK